MEALNQWGWNDDWAGRFTAQAEAGWVPGRVSVEHRGLYHYHGPFGEGVATVSGRLRHLALGRADFPAVGDWVALRIPTDTGPAVIEAVLERTNKLSRKSAGESGEEQILAANLDILFLVTSLNLDLNPNRMERFLAAADLPGCQAVLLLTKSDLCDSPEATVAEFRSRLGNVPVHAISALTGEGLDALKPYLGGATCGGRGSCAGRESPDPALEPDRTSPIGQETYGPDRDDVGSPAPSVRTAAMLGASGVGKSTLLNRLLGLDRQEVRPVRADDDRGRHTTTRRELVALPSGGLLIDSPGIRELQLWAESSDIDAAFEDVARLAERCPFTDCSHVHEPHCAVLRALAEGRLDRARFDSFLKLRREVAFEEARTDGRTARERKEQERRIHRIYQKQHRKQKKGGWA